MKHGNLNSEILRLREGLSLPLSSDEEAVQTRQDAELRREQGSETGSAPSRDGREAIPVPPAR